MLTPYHATPDRPWNLRRVVHLHRRAGYSANWATIHRDLADGADAAVTRLLEGTEDCPAGTPEFFEEMSKAIGDAAVGSENPARLKAWWIYRMLASPDPLGERLALMWHNHFATSEEKVDNLQAMREQNEIFRKFGRARFGELLTHTIKQPAMAVWLDAETNRKGHPNENLARELMELFTLGVGHYTEKDVKEAARALTGWTVKRGKFTFLADVHDEGPKTVIGVEDIGNGDDLLKRLLDHSATASRLAWRLCRTFFGENVVGEDVIEKLADSLRASQLNIGQAVETILRSELFFSDENIASRVMGPVEYVVGAVRSLQMLDPLPSTLLLAEWTARMSQDLFYPPNVFGWDEGRSWINSRTLVARTNFIGALCSGECHLPAIEFDPRRLLETADLPASDVGLKKFLHEILFGEPQIQNGGSAGSGSLSRERALELTEQLLTSPRAQLG